MEVLEQLLPYLFKPGAIVLTLLACLFLTTAILRSYRLPQCFSCGAMKVRLSRPRGFQDSLAGLFLIRPHRCEGCRQRFYAMRLFTPIPLKARRRRGVAVVFRIRNGGVRLVTIRRVDLHPVLRPEPKLVHDTANMMPQT